MKKLGIILSIVIASLVAIVVLALAAVQIALKPEHGNPLLEKYLTQFIDAKAQYDSLDLSIFSTWPDVELRMDGVLIRTLAFEEPDTLLYVKNLGARASAGRFLFGGDIKVDYVTITDPYIKAQKKDSIYSWDVIEPSEDVDTTATELPRIIADLAKIENARIIYRDMDSHFMARIDSLNFTATDTEILPEVMKSYVEAGINSLAYSDSAANRNCKVNDFDLVLNAFRDATTTNLLLFNAKSNDISLKDSMFCVDKTSLDIFARAVADSAFSRFDIDTVGVKLDETALSAKGGVMPETVDTTLRIGLDNFNVRLSCPSLWRLKAFVPSQFAKEVNKYVFDGAIDLDATANGVYEGDNYPVVDASLQIKNLNGGFKKYDQRIDRIDLDLVGRYNQQCKDSTFVKINGLHAETTKNTFDLSGNAGYKNSREYVDISLLANLDLKVLGELYKFDERQRTKGKLTADVEANFFIDDLMNKNLYQLFTKSVVTGDGVAVLIPSQKLGVYVDSLRLNLATNTSTGSMRRSSSTPVTAADSAKMKAFREKMAAAMKKASTSTLTKTKTVRYAKDDTVLVNARLAFSSLNVWYKRKIKAQSQRFSVSLLADDIEPGKVPRFRTSVSFGGLDVSVGDTTKFHAKRASASVSMAKNATRMNVPTTSVRLSFDSITACTADVCALLDSTRIRFATTPRLRIGRRKGKSREQIDSMKVAAMEKIVDLPALLTMFDTISKSDDPAELFMKRFNNEGTIYAKRMRMKHVDFPLRMSVSRLDLEMNDDTIHLNKVRPRVGRSAVTVSGDITNFRRYLLRGRTLNADFSLKSKRIDLNQLMKAFYTYNQNVAEKAQMDLDQDFLADAMEQNSSDIAMGGDDDELEMASDSVDMQGVIVLPKNWDFKFDANVDTIKFSKMNLTNFQGDVTVKDSRLRIKELSTSTEVGNANMSVLYECAVADSAKVKFALGMDSIQVGDLVTYMPELDSIMPMLRSFSGSVKCDASAECSVDKNFNVKLPSVNAALKLRGDSLVLLDGETFTTIAKLLTFSKKTQNRIDSISVELVVRNNEIQIYPFMVGMDRYRLGVGGKQNLDMSFNYHIVVLRPVILSAIGLDVYGTDFDHIKFKLTTPKFKGFDVAIAKGGNLVSTSAIDLRQMMYDAMLNAILKED